MSFQRVHASDAMRVTNCLGLAAGTLEAMPTQPRAHGQSRGTTHFLRTAPVPLSWTGKLGGLVSPMWDQCGIAPSTALNCASPLTGKAAKWASTGRTLWQQSAVHVLIARAAASGSQGRIVSSLSPGRPRADVGLSAVWSDLSAVSTRSGRSFLMVGGSICMYSSRSLRIPLINRD